MTGLIWSLSAKFIRASTATFCNLGDFSANIHATRPSRQPLFLAMFSFMIALPIFPRVTKADAVCTRKRLLSTNRCFTRQVTMLSKLATFFSKLSPEFARYSTILAALHCQSGLPDNRPHTLPDTIFLSLVVPTRHNRERFAKFSKLGDGQRLYYTC